MENHARPSDIDHLRWLSRLGLARWQGARILDLGCGSGLICKEAKRLGAAVAVGIDVLPPQNTGFTFAQADLDDANWAKPLLAAHGAFDLVTAFDIFEHLRSPWDFLVNVHAALTPGGLVVITTPNTNS